MKTKIRRTLGRAALTTLLSLLAACASHEYAAEAIDATVVDAASQKPIAGALVIARWMARGGAGFHSPHDAGSVEVLETLTGPDGKFHFNAWGPKTYEGDGVLLADDPLIVIYKRGYQLSHLSNPSMPCCPRRTCVLTRPVR